MSSEWTTVKLSEVAKIIGGGTPATSESNYWDGNIPWITPKDLSGHKDMYISSGSRSITDEGLKNSSAKLVPKDTVLFTSRAPIGYVAIASQAVCTNQGFKSLVLNEGYDSRYFYYLLKHHTPEIEARATGSTFKEISGTALGSFEISMPPPYLQKRISGVLGSLDDRITLLRETNQTLETIAQALFKSWFVDFDPVRAKIEGRQPEGMDEATAALFPDSFQESELGLVPKGWKVLPFLEVCEMQGGAQPPASEFKDESREGYIRLLQIRDFSTDAHKTYVPLEKKLKTATDDDVLIGRYGSASGDKEKDSLGRVCRGLAGAYNVALMKLVPLLVGREFAMQLVDDPRFYQYLQGVSSKAVQSGFSKKELAQYKVAVPSANLCEKYETFGALIWRRSKEIKEQIENLANLRDTLLPRLISGQLRLPEAEAEIEAFTA